MKTRILHTKFYQDSYILSLPAIKRWLFIYLITNERVEKTGAYELPIPIACVETGLSEDVLINYLKDFTEQGKILYVDGYIIIRNIKKYQDYSKGSSKQIASYEKELNKLPDQVKKVVLQEESLTSSQLVTNQLGTSCQLDIKHKTKIINNKTKIIKHKTNDNSDKRNTKLVGIGPNTKKKASGETKNKVEQTDVIKLVESLKEQVGTLDDTESENQRYAFHLLRRLRGEYPDKNALEVAQALIQIGLADSFHSMNMTSFRYIFKNKEKILRSYRANKKKNNILWI